MVIKKKRSDRREDGFPVELSLEIKHRDAKKRALRNVSRLSLSPTSQKYSQTIFREKERTRAG